MTVHPPAHRILVVAPALDPAIAAAFAGADLRLTPVDQFAEAMRAALRPELLVLDGDQPGAERLVSLLEGLARLDTAPPVLVVGARLPTRLVRSVFRLPRADVIETPFRPEEMTAIVGRLLAPSSSGAARCWSVMGAVGGCGATTIALEMAGALAARSEGRRICLVDLNLADGAAAAYLGLTPTMALSQLTSAERVDASVLAAFTATAAEGFDVLAAPRNPDAFQNVAPGVVPRLLEVACQSYDWVVVDLPRHRQPWTLDVIAGSDELLLISELTVPALLAARAQVGEIEAQAGTEKAPRIVLNRVASRMFSASPSLAEAEKALGLRAEAGISSDWEAAAASINLGGLVRRHRPRSKLVRDVAQLVERLSRSSANPQDTRVA